MNCPHCKEPCQRDEVHNGVGMMYGPYGCICGWSEDERYDCRKERAEGTYKIKDGGYLDQYGGWTRIPTKANPIDWDGTNPDEMPI